MSFAIKFLTDVVLVPIYLFPLFQKPLQFYLHPKLFGKVIFYQLDNRASVLGKDKVSRRALSLFRGTVVLGSCCEKLLLEIGER
jgi:hypothetical protein